MNFDTTHEYYFDDPYIGYCEDHVSLIICEQGRSASNRLVISGISKEQIDKFRLQLNKEALERINAS